MRWFTVIVRMQDRTTTDARGRYPRPYLAERMVHMESKTSACMAAIKQAQTETGHVALSARAVGA